MVKFKPTAMCCGCLSLLVGVELIALLHLINCVSIIALVSSRETLYVYGVEIEPMTQVLAGAWALIGIPVIIGAGVGALYRIELHLRLYIMYMAVSLIFGAFFTLHVLVKGAMCATLASSEVQRMGSVFVCGVVDVFQLFWMLIIGLVHLYFMFVVWSAAEEVAQTAFPELLRYTDALRAVKSPVPPKGSRPVGSRPSVAFPYAAPAPGTPLLAQAVEEKTYQTTQETKMEYVQQPVAQYVQQPVAQYVQQPVAQYVQQPVGSVIYSPDTAAAQFAEAPYQVPQARSSLVSGAFPQSFIPVPPSSIQA